MITTRRLQASTVELLFDGIKDFGRIPHSNSFNVGTGDFTLDCRVKVLEYRVHGGIVSKYAHQTTSQNYDWILETTSTNEIRFRVKVSDIQFFGLTSQILDTDTWYSIRVVKSGTTFYLFVDGILVDSDSFTLLNVDNAQDIILAKYDDVWTSGHLNCSLQDIAYYSNALSTTDYTPDFDTSNLPSSTLFYFPLISDTNDVSGNNHTLILENIDNPATENSGWKTV